jgi:NAD(P)H-nitrite reductase large subunit
MNIVIIGNSAAGTAAIESIRHHDRESTIIQLTDEAGPLYSRCLLSYYLAGTIDKHGLLYREADFHKSNDVELHAGPGSRVVELNPGQRQVTCDNGSKFHYDRLLIGTGASAKLPPNIPGEIGGIFVLRHLADVEAIKQGLKDARRAVVLGGGLIGIKAAAALKECGLKTTVLIRSNRVLSQMIDVGAARIIEKQLSASGIDVLHHTDVSAVMSKANKLCGVKTDQGQVIDCELLVAAKGVNPNTGLIQNTDIAKEWGIKTNSYMQTNHDTIFAAGDVAEAFDIAIEDYAVNALWTCAVQQGRVAGFNMIGKEIPYNGAIGMNSLNVGNTSLISFGITSPRDEAKFKILTLNQPDRDLYKKIILSGNNRIKGLILLGKIANAGVLLSLIQRKVDVGGFADELLGDRFDFGALLRHGGESELSRYYNSAIF